MAQKELWKMSKVKLETWQNEFRASNLMQRSTIYLRIGWKKPFLKKSFYEVSKGEKLVLW